MLHDISNKMILKELDKVVYGHNKAKKSLITLVNRARIRHYQKWGLLLNDNELIKTGKCLLIGGSGTGKTFLVRSLAKLVHFPLLIVDASAFNPTGASGGIKPEKLVKLIYEKAEEYLGLRDKPYFSVEGVVDQMVVFVDEFDKLSSKYEGSSGNWNEHTQTHFLNIFENTDELSGVSWIFAGAFSGLKQSPSSPKKRSIGFHHSDDVSESVSITDEEIVKYGMLPELVGRLTSICELDELTQADYARILHDIVLPNKTKELIHFGISAVSPDKKTLKKISAGAVSSSQGVRYLYREIEKHFLELEFDYESNKLVL